MHVSRLLRRYLKTLASAGAWLLLLVLACVAVFALIFHEVIFEQENGFDLRVFALLAPHASAARTYFFKAVTTSASATFLQVAYAATILLYLFQRSWLRCVQIFVIGVGGFLLNYFMKLTFHRLRPPHPLLEPLQNFSFPSGHATSGFIFYGMLAYLAWKGKAPRALRLALVVLLIAWALLVGFSRIYLRMHFATDVLAGFCSGGAWLGLSILILQRMKKKTTRELGEP